MFVLLALLAVCTLGGLFLMEKTTVSAAEPVQLDDTSASLFLPESYEQYLKLESPSDIAVCERYIAIAEGNDLYIFDRKTENAVYHKFTHGQKISKIQFSAKERLYFSDAGLNFYELLLSDFNSLTASKFNTPLTTFLIEGDTLFEVSTANGSTIYCHAPLDNPSSSIQFDNSTNTIVPRLAFSDEKFYTVCEKTVTIYSRDDENGYKESSSFTLYPNPKDVKSVAVIGNTMYYTVGHEDEGGLYTCDLTTEENSLLFEGDGYGALTSYGGKLYAVKGNGVIEYEVEGGPRPTGYEIASASDSVKRLSGAQDIACAGDLLVIADAGNQRISLAVLDRKGSDIRIADMSVIPCVDSQKEPYTPDLVATDGGIIAVSASTSAKNESCIYLYRIGVNEAVNCFPVKSPVVGLACVNDECYFITEDYTYGKVEESFEPFSRPDTMPISLTADKNGMLYIVDSCGHIQTYTADEFVDSSVEQGEEKEINFPQPFTSFQADGKGNLFYLSDHTLYENEMKLCSLCDICLVYGETGEPLDFVIDFECNEVFFLYENYIVMVAFAPCER